MCLRILELNLRFFTGIDFFQARAQNELMQDFAVYPVPVKQKMISKSEE